MWTQGTSRALPIPHPYQTTAPPPLPADVTTRSSRAGKGVATQHRHVNAVLVPHPSLPHPLSHPCSLPTHIHTYIHLHNLPSSSPSPQSSSILESYHFSPQQCCTCSMRQYCLRCGQLKRTDRLHHCAKCQTCKRYISSDLVKQHITSKSPCVMPSQYTYEQRALQEYMSTYN